MPQLVAAWVANSNLTEIAINTMLELKTIFKNVDRLPERILPTDDDATD